jgi:3-phosphoshikimate 1-carboxyvinyltransferase
MQERPIGILVDALRVLGAKIAYANKEGFPPLKIEGQKLQSKDIEIQSNISSQFISALLLVAPRLPHGLQLKLQEKPSSESYINMTIELLRNFGITVDYNESQINIAHGAYDSKNTTVETDWSAAAFWYQAVAFSENGKLLLKGLSFSSIQGDAILPKIFKQFGVESIETPNGIIIQKNGNIQNNFNWNFSDCPDIALSVIATCAGLGVIGKFSGLESLKLKESNRVQVLETELTKLGFDFREIDSHEWVLINSCEIEASDFDFSEIIIETHNDHRVAMSFAPFAILGKGIQIDNPDVVKKSYPDFWTEFNKLLK